MNPFKKMKENKLKKRSTKIRGMMYYGVVVGTLVVAFIGLQLSNRTYRKDLQVVSFKEDIGNVVIKESMMKPLKIAQRNLNSEMILWKDKSEVVDKYPTMQIRRNTPVYRDMVTEEQVVKYQYIYDLKPDEELLTFRYTSGEAGGRIPRPGDRFRIRASYKMEEKEINLLTQELKDRRKKGEDISDSSGNVMIKGVGEEDILVGNIRTATIFDVVTVMDMLNSDGDSIYEIVKEVESMAPAEKEETLNKDEFKRKVTPDSLLLAVKSDQVSRYVEFQSNTNSKYTLTILSRDKSLMEDDIKSGNSILD